MVVNLTLFFGVWNISEVGNQQLLPLFLDSDNASVSVNGVMQNVAWQEIELNDRDQILIHFDDSPTHDGGERGIFRRLVMTSMEMVYAMTLTIA